MLDSLYNKDVLRKAATISRIGRLETPDATASRVSPVCGSRIIVDIKVSDGSVTDYAQEVHACALGQSAASIMAKQVIGKSQVDIQQLAQQMRAMLVDGSGPPSGDWAELAILAPVHEYKARHGAVMLPFEATLAALADISDSDPLAGFIQLTRNA